MELPKWVVFNVNNWLFVMWKVIKPCDEFTVDKVAYFFAEQVREFYKNKENYDKYLKWKTRREKTSDINK